MKWVLFVAHLPGVVLGHVAMLLLLMVGAVRKPRYVETGVLVAEWREWVSKRAWHYSTTIGRAVFYQQHHLHEPLGASGRTRVQEHELVHVRQGEDLAFLALCLGASTLDWRWFVGMWAASPVFRLLWMATARMRGGDAYRDSEHERSAYAQTDGHPESWIEHRRAER